MTHHHITPNNLSKPTNHWSNHFGNHSSYKWLFFLVILCLIIIIIGYNTGFYGKDNSPTQNSNSNINNKNRPKSIEVKNMEIEALVGSNSTNNNPSSLSPILSNNPLIITDLTNLKNLSKQTNWDNNYDTLIIPSGRIKSDLELDYTPAKDLSKLSNKPKIASIILNVNQLNNLEYSQIITLANTITNQDWSQYIGLNININLDKTTDKSQKLLTQLLAELKSNLKPKNLKLTIQIPISSFEINSPLYLSSALFTQVDQVHIMIPSKKDWLKIEQKTDQKIKDILTTNQIKYIFTN